MTRARLVYTYLCDKRQTFVSMWVFPHENSEEAYREQFTRAHKSQ